MLAVIVDGEKCDFKGQKGSASRTINTWKEGKSQKIWSPLHKKNKRKKRLHQSMENSINQNDRHNNKNLISINRLIGLIK
jgi:hypothetical protein